MTPQQFRSWRSAMGWTQQQAADALGMSKSTVELYESGKRRDNNQPVEIPKVVALACAALRTEKGDDPALEVHLQEWHDAAAAKYASLLRSYDDGEFIAKNHFHFSYGIAHTEGGELDPSRLVDDLRIMNEQVHDRVRTGWTMFYVFTREEIRPRTAVDEASGKGDTDFLQCSLLGASDTGATDYWRISRDGFATLLRGYFEDRPQTAAHFNTSRGSFLSPNWLIRDFAELVRHAQAFGERFSDTASITFRCACHGLSNRAIYDPRAFWHHYKFDPDADARVSTGTWTLADLREKWPTVVSKLAAPIMRAANIGHIVSPEWVKDQSNNWRM